MKYKFCLYFQAIELSDIELSPQLGKESDQDYVPSTDAEFETPVAVRKRKKKSSLAPILTKKTSQSSLFVSTDIP